jgi:hypothetical protein
VSSNELDWLEHFVFAQLQGLGMWTYYLLSIFFPSFVLRTLYADGSSLSRKAMEKYCGHHTHTHASPHTIRSGGGLTARSQAHACGYEQDTSTTGITARSALLPPGALAR